MGISTKDSAAGRRVFGERMAWRRREDLRGEFKRVERGWCLGGERFRQELLEQVETRPGPSHFGEAVQEAETAQAERLVAEGPRRMGWIQASAQRPQFPISQFSCLMRRKAVLRNQAC